METLLSLYGVIGLVYGIYKVTQWGHGTSPGLGENSSRVLSWFMLLVWVLPFAILLWPLIPLWERWEKEKPVRILKDKIINEYVQKEQDKVTNEHIQKQKNQREQEEVDREVERRYEEHRDFKERVMHEVEDPMQKQRAKKIIKIAVEEQRRHTPEKQKGIYTSVDVCETKGYEDRKTALSLFNNNRDSINKYIEETILSVNELGTVNSSMLNDGFFKKYETGTLRGFILARECLKIIIKIERIELKDIDNPQNYPPVYRELMDMIRDYVALFLTSWEKKSRINNT